MLQVVKSLGQGHRIGKEKRMERQGRVRSAVASPPVLLESKGSHRNRRGQCMETLFQAVSTGLFPVPCPYPTFPTERLFVCSHHNRSDDIPDPLPLDPVLACSSFLRIRALEDKVMRIITGLSLLLQASIKGLGIRPWEAFDLGLCNTIALTPDQSCMALSPHISALSGTMAPYAAGSCGSFPGVTCAGCGMGWGAGSEFKSVGK